MISSRSCDPGFGRQRPPRLAQGSTQPATATTAAGGDAAHNVTSRSVAAIPYFTTTSEHSKPIYFLKALAKGFQNHIGFAMLRANAEECGPLLMFHCPEQVVLRVAVER